MSRAYSGLYYVNFDAAAFTSRTGVSGRPLAAAAVMLKRHDGPPLMPISKQWVEDMVPLLLKQVMNDCVQ